MSDESSAWQLILAGDSVLLSIVLVEGDKRLFNQYGVMLVNPEKYPTVKKDDGQAFVDWLISQEGQAAIAGYTIDGQKLFFPDADKKGS